jgi:hypothetical protein
MTPALAFWNDPPWRGGRTPFRLGLAPVAERAWLPDPVCESEYQRKRILLSEHRAEVLAVIPNARQVVDVAGKEIRDRLTARGAREREHQESHPLARAALIVPDDLCILVPGDTIAEESRAAASASDAWDARAPWVLAGACLCSPSYWRLADKIGRPMPGVHAPVPGLERALGSRIAHFLDALPVGQTFERRNWNFHRDTTRFHPDHEIRKAPLTPAECASLNVRSERQTLHKLSNGVLLFTIAVQIHPLAEIRAYPAAAKDLLIALTAMSEDERRASSYRHHGEALREWLSSGTPG